MALTDPMIKSLGDEILDEFGATIHEILKRRLEKKLGDSWFESSFKNDRKNSKKSERDLYILLRQLIHERNNDYRSAINSEFKLNAFGSKYVLKQLDKVFDCRNKWSHRTTDFTEEDFRQLLRPVYNVLSDDHPLGKKCFDLLESISKQSESPVTYLKFSRAFGEAYNEIEFLQKNQEEVNLLRQQIEILQNPLESKASSIKHFENLNSLKKSELIELISELRFDLVESSKSYLSLYCQQRHYEYAHQTIKWYLSMRNYLTLVQDGLITGQEVDSFGDTLRTEAVVISNKILLMDEEMGAENCSCSWCQTVLDKPGAVLHLWMDDIDGVLFDQVENNSTVDNSWFGNLVDMTIEESGIAKEVYAIFDRVEKEFSELDFDAKGKKK
jgi:hypothetical protein